MTLQELLIDGIEFLESLPLNADVEAKLAIWLDQLNQVNMQAGTTPTCPTGYYWDGTLCTKDVG